jgi:hypothetical protein
MWRSTIPSSTAYALPPSSGSSGFTSMATLSSSSTNSWGSQTIMTPAWQNTNRRSESSRRSSMGSNFMTSSGETTRQPTPSPGRGIVANRPLWAYSCRTYSSRPSDSRKIAWHPRWGALMDEDGLASVPGTSPNKGGLAPTLEANPGTPARLVGHAREPRTEIAAITGQPGSDTD